MHSPGLRHRNTRPRARQRVFALCSLLLAAREAPAQPHLSTTVLAPPAEAAESPPAKTRVSSSRPPSVLPKSSRSQSPAAHLLHRVAPSTTSHGALRSHSPKQHALLHLLSSTVCQQHRSILPLVSTALAPFRSLAPAPAWRTTRSHNIAYYKCPHSASQNARSQATCCSQRHCSSSSTVNSTRPHTTPSSISSARISAHSL